MVGASVDVHSYLFVECLYFVPHLSLFFVSLLVSLFFLHFYHKLHCPFKGGIFEKTKRFFGFFFFVFFLFFVLCSDIMQKCIMRGRIIFFASNELFIILWTNSRDLKARERGFRVKEIFGSGHHFCCFYLPFLNVTVKETCWRQSSSSLLCSLNGLDFSQDDKRLEGPSD